MSKTVHVDLHERGYDIFIGTGVTPGATLAEEKGRRVLIVSDSNVDPLYGGRCEQQLLAQGFNPRRVVVPAGEESKSPAAAQKLYSEAVRAGMDRRSVVVALGGGVIGDLAGFVAATYLRGIRLIQVPTTLLAMVDSSVGGKTAINLKEGKNLVGAFHQPIEVCVDLDTLKTLPERDYAAGLAEVVKYGVIWDATFFGKVEAGAEAILKRDGALLAELIARCCEIKAEIVRVDEMETGVRAILNFGHTLGHALEQTAGYGRWRHGEAVAVGMVYAAELSAMVKGFRREDGLRIRQLLQRLGLPTAPEKSTAWKDLRHAMKADKKSRDQTPRFVLAEKMGAAVYGCEVPDAALEKGFESFQA